MRGWDLAGGTGWVGWGRVRAEFKDPRVWGWGAGLGAKDQSGGREQEPGGYVPVPGGGRGSMGGRSRAPEVRRIGAQERSELGMKGPRNEGAGA